MLVVFGGLPGAGKTTISREVARSLGAMWLRIDAIEAAMWRSGIARAQPSGIAAYVVAHAVADGNLELGATVVIDAVNPVEAARASWRELAARRDVPLRVIEVICPDATEHRRRVEERAVDIADGRNPSWDEVIGREYEPWTEPRLVLESSQPNAQLVAEAVRYIRQASAAG